MSGRTRCVFLYRTYSSVLVCYTPITSDAKCMDDFVFLYFYYIGTESRYEKVVTVIGPNNIRS